MSQHSTRRQKAGRALLVAALVAVPLTATVSYAEGQSVEEAFSDGVNAPPAPPAPPSPPAAPGAPEAPPAPPAPPEVGPDDAVWHEIDEERTADGKVTRTEKVYVVKGGDKMSAEQREEMLREMREARTEAIHARDEAKQEAQHARAEARREMRVAIAEAANARAEAEQALREVRLELENEGQGRTIVEMKCQGDDIASHKTRNDGTNVVMICKSKVMAEALAGLKEARAEIAKDTEMDAETRAEVLRSLDEQIRNWNKRG